MHVDVFMRIAAQVATSIERAHLFDDLMRTKLQLEEANYRLAELAHIDGLTGVANRRYFDQQLDREWRRAIREGTTLSVILTDVDHFKLFNDTYGHLDGDQCLKRVAEVIRKSLRRATDMVARYGGEEFVVLLAASTQQSALEIATLLRQRIYDLNMPHSAAAIRTYPDNVACDALFKLLFAS